LEDKGLANNFFLDAVQKELGIDRIDMISAMKYEGSGAGQTYNNLKNKYSISLKRIRYLKEKYPSANDQRLILRDESLPVLLPSPEMIVPNDKEGMKEIVEMLIKSNEEKAVKIALLEKRLDMILKGKEGA